MIVRAKALHCRAKKLKTSNEYRIFLKDCEKCLKDLKEYQKDKHSSLKVSDKSRLHTIIVDLSVLKSLVEQNRSRQGLGLTTTIQYLPVHETPAIPLPLVFEDVETAFKRRITTRLIINTSYIDPKNFLDAAKCMTVELVRLRLNEHKSLKVNTVLSGEFSTLKTEEVKTIKTSNYELFMESDLNDWYKNCVCKPILTKLQEFQERDSGWALQKILSLSINVNKYNPFNVGCNTVWIPQEISLKHATINVKTDDNACFYWSVMAILYPAVGSVNRQSSYRHYSEEFVLQNLSTPIKLSQIKNFEIQNDISINIFCLEKKKNNRDQKEKYQILPLRLTPSKRERHANLLMLQEFRNPSLHHFIAIKNLGRLVGMQLSRHGHRKDICDR